MCRRGGLKEGCEGRFSDADLNFSLEPTTNGNRAGRFAKLEQTDENMLYHFATFSGSARSSAVTCESFQESDSHRTAAHWRCFITGLYKKDAVTAHLIKCFFVCGGVGGLVITKTWVLNV